MKNYFWIGLIVVVVLITLFQTLQINSLKESLKGTITGKAVQSQSSGETYEQMMARMHPEQVQRKPATTSSLPTMVGGC